MSGLSYCSELSVGGSILHINIQYQEKLRKKSLQQRHLAREGWWFALTVEIWAQCFYVMWFQKGKRMLITAAVLVLDFACALAKLRLDREETGTLESNAPRWDLMRASCIKSHREKGYSSQYGSRQSYIHAHVHTHCKDTFKHSHELIFPDNHFEITFHLVGKIRLWYIVVHLK